MISRVPQRWLSALWYACIAIACGIALAHWHPSIAQAPASGVVIDNQAFADYTPASGVPQRISSNIISVRIGQVSGFVLAAAQERFVVPGGQAVFAHTLRNTGNGVDVFDLSLVNNAGGFDFTSIVLYPDVNGDGIADGSQPLSGSLSLAPGQTLSFVAVVSVPPGAAVGTRDQFTLSVRGNAAAAAAAGYLPAVAQSNVDGATVTMGPVIVLEKSLSATQGPSPSTGPVEFTIKYRNNGFASASNVVISDNVPGAGLGFNTQGFQYVAGSASWNGAALSDAPGGDPVGIAYEYSNLGVYANTVRAVLASVPAGASGVLKFSVTVAAGLVPGDLTTRNMASVSYNDGVQMAVQESNPASYAVLGRSPGVDLTLSKSATAMIVPGQCTVFKLQVSNIGTQTSSGSVAVVDTLPAGLEYLPSCSILGVTKTSGGQGWTCPANPATGAVTCTTTQNLLPKVGTVPGLAYPLEIVVKANAATLVPPLPALTAVPNTVTVINQAQVNNALEPTDLRDNNSATAPLVVGPGATVRGTVWLDTDHNRVYNPAIDLPAPNLRVELLDPVTGVLIASVLTNPDGSYEIGNLLPGSYRVRFVEPISGAIYGRPVCNEAGLPSGVASNCVPANLSHNPSTLDAEGGSLLITLNPGDVMSQMSLPIDPSGVIYDSITRQPVAGATVVLQYPTGFNPSLHLIGGAANVTQITGTNGWYQYILTGTGATYCATLPNGCVVGLLITPPSNYLQSVSQILPPSATVGACAEVNCIDPTGLAPAGTAYPLQAQVGAPPIGSPTPYFFKFQLTVGDPDVVNNHIPVDPLTATGQNILLEKKASKLGAEVGDFVDYTINIKNGTNTPATGVNLVDRLPIGFRYVPGTSALDGVKVADPSGTATGGLTFSLPSLAANSTKKLTYRVRLEFAASNGDGINHVSAHCTSGANSAVCSNTAQAKVQVLEGVLSGKPVLIGKVYLDCNRNRIQSDREVGVPGVRLFLQDGTYAITDSEGKFSIYGLAARTHVLKLDPITLPAGWEGIMLSNRSAGDTNSLFVDLKYGELHKANFADGACHARTVTEVHRRRAAADSSNRESGAGILPLADEALQLTAQTQLTDNRALPAAGAVANIAAGNAAVTSVNSVFAGANAANSLQLPEKMKLSKDIQSDLDTVILVTLEKQLESANNQFEFMNLKEGQILPITQTHVQIKGGQGASVVLSVNGQKVDQNRIGKRSVNVTNQTQAWEYIAVPLAVGNNEITAQLTDGMGIDRGTIRVNVVAPGELAVLKATPENKLLADSKAVNRVRIELFDTNGVPVMQRTQVSLKLTGLTPGAISAARITSLDLDPREDGVQLFANKGFVWVDLQAPDSPSAALLNLQAGSIKHTVRLEFSPYLRPMIGVGIVDAAIQLRKLKVSQLVGNGRSSFEDELRCFGRPTLSIASQAGQWDCLSRDFGERANASVQTAFFFKGAVKGEYLLTLAYDNAKDVKSRVFRDISPDEYYPIYGDSSQRGFDANSSEKLYVRVDKGNEYVLYGDLTTQANNASRQLTQYSRTLTGIKAHSESKDGTAQGDLILTKDSLKQKVVEFPANGTSGPFSLPATGVVNSEKVEILVRDRNAASTVISRTALSRFADYEIEPFTGRLLLRAPVPSLDVNLNPMSIRVVFEQDDATEKYWTVGVQGSKKISETLEVGGIAVQERRETDPSALYGVFVTKKLGDDASATVEIAKTDKQSVAGVATGQAVRVEFLKKTEALDVKVQVQKADTGFDNPSANLAAGKTELAGKVSYKISPKTTVTGEVLRTHDDTNQVDRQGASLKVEQQFANGAKVEAGVRRSESHDPTAVSPSTIDDAYTSVRAKATVPINAKTDAYLELEKALDSDRKLVALGADYRLSNRGRVYARHEFSNTLGSDYLSPTARAYRSVLGLDAALTDQTQAFSEYRLRDALAGSDAQAAFGLRQTWAPAEGLKLNTSLERTEIVRQAPGTALTSPSSAATLAASYTAAQDWKATGRLEWRTSDTQTSWLNTLGYAYKLNADWSLLARNVLSRQHTSGAAAADLDKSRQQLGIAYRGTDRDVWNGLAKIERRSEQDTQLSLKRTVILLSSHVNYQVDRQWWLSGHLANKRVTDLSAGLSNQSRGNLMGARLTYDLARDWDLSVLLLAIKGGDNAGGLNRKTGLGFELGYRLQENLWLSGGYNVWGVKDRDLTQNEYTDHGFYIRLRYKFDESLFDRPRDRVQD